MPIRVIHGDGDLIGSAFAGVGQAADKIADARQRDRVLDDREERTAAYAQRIADAQRLKTIELAMEQEELAGEQRREQARVNATRGMAQAEVGRLSDNEFWTKDDEAGIRAIFSDPDLTAKDKEDAAERYFETVADRIEQQEVEAEKLQLRDIVQRAATPGEDGVAYLEPDEAQLYMEQIESGDNLESLRRDLRRQVQAQIKNASVERDMALAFRAIDEGSASDSLGETEKDRLDDLKDQLLFGQISPRQALFQARAIQQGNGGELQEFARLVAASQERGGVGAPPAPAGVPPEPQPSAAADGVDEEWSPTNPLNRVAAESLRAFMAQEVPDDLDPKKAKRKLERWAKDNGLTLRQIYDQLLHDAKQYEEMSAESRAIDSGWELAPDFWRSTMQPFDMSIGRPSTLGGGAALERSTGE